MHGTHIVCTTAVLGTSPVDVFSFFFLAHFSCLLPASAAALLSILSANSSLFMRSIVTAVRPKVFGIPSSNSRTRSSGF
jgi:hypothetical protein